MSPLAAAEALDLARLLEGGDGVGDLAAEAAAVRDLAYGNRITYSPKVFVPLTKLCRDVCHYCTFAQPPRPGERYYMTIDEVVDVASRGAEQGCREVLFTLGDKPELRYRAARDELAALGHETTLGYLHEAAAAVIERTGLLPHLNPGVLTGADFEKLRPVAASMGLMIESTSERLMGKGLVHHGSPDKVPETRLATLNEAGKHRVPFTTGILIGIGETWEERALTLIAIQEAHARWGHIQEVIVQNFRAKPDTLMRDHPEPTADEMATTIALARLVLDPQISVQAPPNLAADAQVMRSYVRSGINDWGGVSPVTIDHVNPEAPWPDLAALRDATEAEGFLLLPRLTVYPRYAFDPSWVDARVRPHVLAHADSEALARDDSWHSGEEVAPPQVHRTPMFWSGSRRVGPRPAVARLIERGAAGAELDEDAIALLMSARGPEVTMLTRAADDLRRMVNGEEVTFVVNRNINYTNMCYFRCGFCAFSKGPKSLNLRGEPYLLDMDEIGRRTVEARLKGATEVCLQGGIHPSFTGDFYIEVLDAIKRVVPDIHIHAFSPLEVWQGAETKGATVPDFLAELKDHGLGTLPGTAAEILDDEVRAVICPDKINTEQWSYVARSAHSLGLPMSTTMMFGHADTFRSWARHLIVLRDIQKDTGGFTEFVPLPFVHMGAPIYLKGRARRGPTFEEAVKVHSVARLALHPWITNIQASWVKLGRRGSQIALSAGANDLGGTLMDENISRSAGASHGQELTADDMRSIGEEIGRPWARRNTVYGVLERADTVRFVNSSSRG